STGGCAIDCSRPDRVAVRLMTCQEKMRLRFLSGLEASKRLVSGSLESRDFAEKPVSSPALTRARKVFAQGLHLPCARALDKAYRRIQGLGSIQVAPQGLRSAIEETCR